MVKLTAQEMGNGIRYLKAYYPKWDLNINDSFILSVWFDSLMDLSAPAFLNIIKDYCKSNTYPPSCPTDILKMIPQVLSVDDAWGVVLDICNRNTSNEFFLKEVHKTNKLVYDCIKSFDMYNHKDSFGHDCINYIRNSFKRQYARALDSFKVKYVGNQLTTSQMLLG